MPANPFPNSVVVSLPAASFASGQLQNGFGGVGANASSPGSRILYVNSASPFASNGNAGNDPIYPLATLNNALTKTINNNGDLIYVGPRHVETVSTAGGLTFPAATAIGVTVIFLGNETDRGQITFTATTSTMTMVANSVTLINPRFVCGIDAVAAPIVITGTDNKIINAEYFDAPAFATTIQVITTAACLRLTIDGYTYYESTTGTSKTEAIRIVGGDRHRIKNLNIAGSFSTANFNNVTTATTNFMASNWNLANPLTTAAGVPLQTYVATSTFMSPDLAPSGGTAGNEYAASKTLATPQGATATVFTVVGGPIQILEIAGYITTAIGAGANATKLTYTPTTAGTSTDLCGTVDINGAVAGDILLLQTSFATAMVLSTNAVESIAQIVQEKLVYPLLVPPGALRVNCAGSDGGSGRVQWCMRYKPLAPGVIVI